ncbi:N-acetylmuramoyl-L-alanine amidase CwlD [Peribacillus saganii]|uniref:N-acetylmuramoyl-L-alanine amidase CwlD n=1 Tax=Peribacillus saganii TaxID=2303992 RepID=A0A372LMI4_9BACI|nr:N-acetylmuramoyl-L-alanine amidase CwlD [Peribacillus saganii]RFU68587.1 N-acetylmuramoyl-L-alanine amidase CwlD [Peribacillus saganii]
MRRKLKYTGFALGIILLFLIMTMNLVENNSWKPWNLPLSGKVIILDAGHGAPDAGANFLNALEKDIALSITKKIRTFLEEQGALVILTREDDGDLAAKETKGLSNRKREDLRKRVEIINNSDADLFLSIHLNSLPSHKWKGAQTFYSLRYEENKQVATYIQSEIKRNLENTDRKAKTLGSVYILKNAKKPGALVEVGFLSNPEDRKNLTNEDYQESIAASIYTGILKYFTEEPPK